MSPKVAKESKASKSSDKPAKEGKAAAASGKKAVKAAAKDEEDIVGTQSEGDENAVDPDELEEQEDERASKATSGEGNAAALAAASSSTEMSASFKNFRHHPDMENFYRFIYENDLRHEALAIIDQIQIEKQARRAMKSAKSNAH